MQFQVKRTSLLAPPLFLFSDHIMIDRGDLIPSSPFRTDSVLLDNSDSVFFFFFFFPFPSPTAKDTKPVTNDHSPILLNSPQVPLFPPTLTKGTSSDNFDYVGQNFRLIPSPIFFFYFLCVALPQKYPHALSPLPPSCRHPLILYMAC